MRSTLSPKFKVAHEVDGPFLVVGVAEQHVSLTLAGLAYHALGPWVPPVLLKWKDSEFVWDFSRPVCLESLLLRDHWVRVTNVCPMEQEGDQDPVDGTRA